MSMIISGTSATNFSHGFLVEGPSNNVKTPIGLAVEKTLNASSIRPFVNILKKVIAFPVDAFMALASVVDSQLTFPAAGADAVTYDLKTRDNVKKVARRIVGGADPCSPAGTANTASGNRHRTTVTCEIVGTPPSL